MCAWNISNRNIYIPCKHTPQIFDSIYPIQRLFFKNVQYPTLCPKGTKKPFQFTIIPQMLPCFIQSQYIYSMHTYSPNCSHYISNRNVLYPTLFCHIQNKNVVFPQCGSTDERSDCHLDWMILDIWCICAASLLCESAYEKSDVQLDWMICCIGCICLTFLHCGF